MGVDSRTRAPIGKFTRLVEGQELELFGEEESRGDRVYPHLCVRQVNGEPFSEIPHCALACRVGGNLGKRAVGIHR